MPKPLLEVPSRPYKIRAPNINRVYKDESEETSNLIDVDTPHVTSVDSSFLSQDVKTSSQADRRAREEETAAGPAGDKSSNPGKGKARSGSSLSRNSDNPVVLGNALLITLLGAGLGVGAYKKHANGQLSWGVIGAWSGAVGALGVADYFCSKWLFQNKYPPK